MGDYYYLLREELESQADYEEDDWFYGSTPWAEEPEFEEFETEFCFQ